MCVPDFIVPHLTFKIRLYLDLYVSKQFCPGTSRNHIWNHGNFTNFPYNSMWQQRITLHEIISEYAVFNLHTLLYGRDNLSPEINHIIIDAVSTYISTTGRFS